MKLEEVGQPSRDDDVNNVGPTGVACYSSQVAACSTDINVTSVAVVTNCRSCTSRLPAVNNHGHTTNTGRVCAYLNLTALQLAATFNCAPQ
jgi:hypothetical protein